MNRRRILRAAAAISALPATHHAGAAQRLARARPGAAGWPAPADWDRLRQAVGGRLVAVRSPLERCMADPASDECTQDPTRTQESLLSRRRGRPDPDARLGRCLDVAAERLCGGRAERRPTSSPPSISPARTICGWSSKAAATAIRARPTRADSLLIWTRAMDGDHPARRVRRRGLRGQAGAAAGGHGRGGRDLGAGLRRRHDAGRAATSRAAAA